jgi:hypothetical protein
MNRTIRSLLTCSCGGSQPEAIELTIPVPDDNPKESGEAVLGPELTGSLEASLKLCTERLDRSTPNGHAQSRVCRVVHVFLVFSEIGVLHFDDFQNLWVVGGWFEQQFVQRSEQTHRGFVLQVVEDFSAPPLGLRRARAVQGGGEGMEVLAEVIYDRA